FDLYDSAYVNGVNADFVRTTNDFVHWSDSTLASVGGAANGSNGAECPFVVRAPDGYYALFRTQRYGQDAQTTTYHSPTPVDFGINDDRYRQETLSVAAPELVLDQGKWYIASVNPGFDGIRMARLAW